LPLGTLIDNQTNVANGTVIEFEVQCEYDSSYQFYFNVTDSEDSVQSSLFNFSTSAEPELPPETSPLNAMMLIIAVTFAGVAGTAFLRKLSNAKPEAASKSSKQRSTHFFLFSISWFFFYFVTLMGCGAHLPIARPLCDFEAGAKNNRKGDSTWN
jgi:hypothetical protein